MLKPTAFFQHSLKQHFTLPEEKSYYFSETFKRKFWVEKYITKKFYIQSHSAIIYIGLIYLSNLTENCEKFQQKNLINFLSTQMLNFISFIFFV